MRLAGQPGTNGKESTLRARILPQHARRDKPWKAFQPGKWYPAEFNDANGIMIRLSYGADRADWPREQVEIRSAGDEEWEVRSPSRVSLVIDGQTVEYPARLAECPEGHLRPIPSRFDAAVVELKCAECRRHYRLVAD
jgi:hypothetical protein